MPITRLRLLPDRGFSFGGGFAIDPTARPATRDQALGMGDEEMEMCRSRRCVQNTLGASISSLAMFVGGWGPAFPEEGDVGRKYFNSPVLMVFHGVAEMVMGGAHILRSLLFESAPEYGDFRGDTFLLVCP